jgi:hypothetical protein
MFKANLRSQVRQTVLPKWKPLLPLFEAVMNSIQSIRDAKRSAGSGRVLIEIERDSDLFSSDTAYITSFTVTDNGIGLDDTNFDSFNTAYSDHKESMGGKGLGRFTWLKAFESAEIKSVFTPIGEGSFRRDFIFHNDYNPDTGNALPYDGSNGTSVRLRGFKDPYRQEFHASADQLAQRLVEHFLLVFLEPDCPTIVIHDQGLTYSANDVFEKDFKASASIHEFEIKGVPFQLHGFRLITPRLSYHKLIYAASQRSVVSDNLKDFVPNLGSRLPDGHGGTFVYLGIVQSPYLTQHVNTGRSDFDLADTEDADVSQVALFVQEIRRADIREEAIKLIQEDLYSVITGINEEKEERIRSYVHTDAPQYKVLMKYAGDFINKISPTASKIDIEVALHRELYQRESDMKREGSKIIKEAERVDDYEGYHARLVHFMNNYNELGAAALAQYVMHRKIILQFLDQAISMTPENNRFPLEEVVHQLVFPMRSTSDDIPSHEQNLWMIDERLAFHSFIASDKQLNGIADRFESDSSRRPDLFIFDETIVFSGTQPNEGPINSITTVEFKRPGRDDYTAIKNPVSQSIEIIKRIRTGKFMVKGRPVSTTSDNVPATAYAVCDITPTLRTVLEDMDAQPTPDNQGYYGFHGKYKIYWEVMDYNKLLRDAEKRNRVFFDKLNILGNHPTKG